MNETPLPSLAELLAPALEKKPESDPFDLLKPELEQAQASKPIVSIQELLTPADNKIRVQYLENYGGPPFSNSLDIYTPLGDAITLNNAERRFYVVKTGMALSLPVGFEAQIRPSFDLASKGIFVQFGTVDSRYRGELMCMVFNLSTRAFRFEPGTRIAQMVVLPTVSLDVLPVQDIHQN